MKLFKVAEGVVLEKENGDKFTMFGYSVKLSKVGKYYHDGLNHGILLEESEIPVYIMSLIFDENYETHEYKIEFKRKCLSLLNKYINKHNQQI